MLAVLLRQTELLVHQKFLFLELPTPASSNLCENGFADVVEAAPCTIHPLLLRKRKERLIADIIGWIGYDESTELLAPTAPHVTHSVHG